jgi:hypothetical protein
VVSDRDRTKVFARYTLAASLATAAGSLIGGLSIGALQRAAFSRIASYRIGVGGYALMGVVLLALFFRLSSHVEAAAVYNPLPRDAGPQGRKARSWFGLRQSRRVVWRLSGLFALDAFGGGFVIQSLAAYWFHIRYGVQPAALGGIFFGANLLAGLSALLAARLAARFGLINTMVFTHLPSNILLILVPVMPNLSWAIAVLFLRFSISQMDVPTRQSYVMAVVPPDERSAATGAAIAPFLAGQLLANPATGDLLFYLGGGLKIVYDLLLYRSFIKVLPPEERK